MSVLNQMLRDLESTRRMAITQADVAVDSSAERVRAAGLVGRPRPQGWLPAVWIGAGLGGILLLVVAAWWMVTRLGEPTLGGVELSGLRPGREGAAAPAVPVAPAVPAAPLAVAAAPVAPAGGRFASEKAPPEAAKPMPVAPEAKVLAPPEPLEASREVVETGTRPLGRDAGASPSPGVSVAAKELPRESSGVAVSPAERGEVVPATAVESEASDGGEGVPAPPIPAPMVRLVPAPPAEREVVVAALPGERGVGAPLKEPAGGSGWMVESGVRSVPAPPAKRGLGALSKEADRLVAEAREVRLGDPARALGLYRQAMRVDPGHADAYQGLIEELIATGAQEEAEEWLAKGVGKSGRNTEVSLMRLRVALQRERWEAADRILGGLPPASMRTTEVLGYTALLRRKQGRHGEATSIYRELAQREPGNGQWWLGLGASLEQQGEQAEAQAAYRRAWADPDLDNNVREFLQQRLRVFSQGQSPKR